MVPLVLTIIMAFILWALMFSPAYSLPGRTLEICGFVCKVNFWWMMTFSAGILAFLGFTLGGKKHQEHSCRLIPLLMLGIGIAAVLWLVFWMGDKISMLIFSFAQPQISEIYAMKNNMPLWEIGLLLLFIIGPSEEIFWRGYIQRTLASVYTPNIAFIITVLAYTLVHIVSLNFMLIMAAMVCGITWGILYRLRPNWYAAIILSHALWDTAVFIWFPL